MRTMLVLTLTALLLNALPAGAQQPTPAKWTVFVYMNADNELEPYALKDLKEMSNMYRALTPAKRAQFLADVHVVILFDRALKERTPDLPDWNGAVEFRFPDKPDASTAKPANMGDGKTLADFLKRGIQRYPAERYAVVVWCHGAGWRDIQVARDDRSNFPGRPVPQRAAAAEAAKPKVPAGIEAPLFKAASGDHGDQLYNAEIAQALASAFNGRKVELLAFDSCLMGMLEAAYAFRDVAGAYVASEELVPSYGFDYNRWLTALATRPEMNGLEAGKAIVDSYQAYYTAARSDSATLAAIDLSMIDQVAKATSAFSNALRAALNSERAAIKKARAPEAVTEYDPFLCDRPSGNAPPYCHGGVFHHVDLARFAQSAETEVSNADVRSTAAQLRKAITDAVGGRRWAAPGREGGKFGSAGLAIYFPADVETFLNDPWNDHSYDKPVTNRFTPYPVKFVTDHTWADFLHDYYFPAEVHQ